MKARISQLSVLFFVMSLFFVTTSQAQESTKSNVEKEYKVSEKVLKTYVGSYSFDNGMGAEITLKEGKLYGAQAGGADAPMPLFAVSNKKFLLKAMGAEIEFSKNDKGETTGLTFFQQGQEMFGSKD
ncbi:MAG: DUF3471 domain-containing protein [Flavobacteriaceae bacterium]|nr:DUF3471 domain-containing protein [Flavobacteriaceae bacterium]